MNLAGLNSILKKNKKTNKESFEKKHCFATSCRGKWQELRNVRKAYSKRLRQYFPRVSYNYLLRRENCSVFLDIFENFLRTLTFIPRSLTFSILNQIVSDCTPAKTKCKTVWAKVNPAANVFMHFENSRKNETKKWNFESKDCVTELWEMKRSF